MSGMNSGINVNDPTVVAAFKTALVHQGIIALLIFALLGFAWITVRAWLPAAQAGTAAGPGSLSAPAAAEPSWRQLAADRVRAAVGLRRDLAGPAEDGYRAPVAGHRACGGEFTALGAGGGELGRDHLVVSPDAGRGVSGVDPGRDRHLDARIAPGPGVPARRAGQRRMGPGRVGLRRVVRRDLRPRADLAVRRPRRRPHLHGGGRADRPARTHLACPLARPGDPHRDRPVPGRHGGAAGLARAGVLAGNRSSPARDAGRHDRRYGTDAAAGFPGQLGQRVHLFRRGARVRGQPVHRGGARGDRCGVPDRTAAAGPPGSYRVHRAVPGRLGADRGLRVLRRPGYRSQQHAPVRPAGRRWLPRAGTSPGDGGGTGHRGTSRGRLAGADPAGLRAPVGGHRKYPVGRRRRGARADHPGCRPDGRRPGQPERRPDPRRGHRRVDRAAELPGQGRSSSPTSTAGR